MAVTFDDLPIVTVARFDRLLDQAVTDGILSALAHHKLSAVGFVNENKLFRGGSLDSGRVDLLRRWLRAGHELGNHTYSHLDLHTTPLTAFQDDVLRGERFTRAMLAEAGREPRWFRHPFLHTGRDLDTKAGLERFLLGHGYRVAPVTIDNYDYVFAAAFDRSRASPPERARIVTAYLQYMADVVGFYEGQSEAIIGRLIPQILLLHANALNAETLDALLRMFTARGYQFTSFDCALLDPAYQRADTYVGPAGITWLHRWALTEGVSREVFAGEPEVPGWVREAARVR